MGLEQRGALWLQQRRSPVSSLPKLACPSRAPAAGGLRAGVSVPLLLEPLTPQLLPNPPRPSQAPTTLGGNKSCALLNFGAAVGTRTGEQRGLCAKMWCHRYPKSIPVPSVPGGPRTPWVALLVSHPPKSLENHQFLSKMCSLGPRGSGRSCAPRRGGCCAGRGERGAW